MSASFREAAVGGVAAAECTAFEDCVARSTLDLDTFWSRALVEDDFPVDFYAAGGG